MRIEDIVLVRAKMKSLGMTVKNLANKIHTSPTKLDKILNQKDSSQKLEDKLIQWLNK